MSLKFCHDEQIWFSKISGDDNPMHVDPEYSKRTLYGQQVVHGIHVLLRVMNVIGRDFPSNSLRSIKVRFQKPVYLDKEYSMEFDQQGSLLKFVVKADLGSQVLCGELVLGHSVLHTERLTSTYMPFSDQIRNIDFHENRSFSLHLEADLLALRKVYQNLGFIDDAVLARFLQATRVVGTVAPGLHSIFSSYFFDRDLFVPSDVVDYKITKYDERFQLLKIDTEAEHIVSIKRPEPCLEPQCSDFKSSSLTTDLLKGYTVLVLGASRGIGAGIVRGAICSGANVIAVSRRFSVGYNAGDNYSSRLMLIEADLTSNLAFIESLESAKPIIIANCATPKIVDDSVCFSSKLKFFQQLYVDVPDAVVRKLNGSVCLLFNPSTVVIDKPVKGFEAYIESKLKMEQFFCNTSYPCPVLMPRLDRIETDQNQSILPYPAESIKTVVMDVIGAWGRTLN